MKTVDEKIADCLVRHWKESAANTKDRGELARHTLAIREYYGTAPALDFLWSLRRQRIFPQKGTP